MSVYLGYYRTAQEFTPDDKFLRMVVDLPEKLPAGCLLVGSYAPAGAGAQTPERPAVLIVETDNQADLDFIGSYYAGYLAFDWAPVRAVGATRAEREAWAAAVVEAAAEQAADQVTADVYGPALVHQAVDV